MANFKNTDMLYKKDYTWNRDSGDGPYRGKLDRDKLDRDEGYEVLDFANSYLTQNVLYPEIEDLHKLEKLLRDVLPSKMMVKIDIIDFLNKNW